MSDARDRILTRVRGSLARSGPLDRTLAEALESRLRAHPAGERPAVTGDLVAHFARKVELAAATLDRAASPAAIEQAVLRFLDDHGLGRELVAASDPLLASVPWSNQLAVAHRAARDADRVSITSAFAGVAETGTVALLSDPASPTTLNFLPENHLVVLARERIVAHLEDVWALVRAERRALPRAVNLITGPSRTADVELSLEFGAHGPRRLHVILLE